jgi:hypothetical protein
MYENALFTILIDMYHFTCQALDFFYSAKAILIIYRAHHKSRTPLRVKLALELLQENFHFLAICDIM